MSSTQQGQQSEGLWNLAKVEVGQGFQVGQWQIQAHHSQKGLKTILCDSTLYTWPRDWKVQRAEGTCPWLCSGQGERQAQVPACSLQMGREAGCMVCNRDTRVGCVRAQPASPLGCPFRVPSSLSVPHSHPQGPWKLGRPSPSTPAATPARPAMLQAWPTSTWSSLCEVSVPGPDSCGPGGRGAGGGLGDSLGEKTQPAYVLHSEVSGSPCSL